ncbi:MAG: cytochrome c oxidase subunit 3 [Pseudomonadales bacterium]|nr:cytochrome c oxidase subunit 3 [Pseudomonadales bacterium]
MAQVTAEETTGLATIAKDWSSDVTTFKGVPWGKAMMWIFLLSDTFIFSMTVRATTAEAWPNASEVFSLTVFGQAVPLLLIAIMTFDLITSSGTMALAVNYGYRREKKKAIRFMYATAFFGAVFVGMQMFEWTKLIMEGVRPWGNPWGAPQFGSTFFMITGFHGLHVSAGVVYLIIIAGRIRKGRYDNTNFEIVEITGLYWHFVDLVWVFIFAFFYLW